MSASLILVFLGGALVGRLEHALEVRERARREAFDREWEERRKAFEDWQARK